MKSLQRARRDLLTCAGTLEDDSGFYEFCETTLDEKDLTGLYRGLAEKLKEKAEFFDTALKRFGSSSARAEQHGIKLRNIVDAADLEELIGTMQTDLVDAEDVAGMAEKQLESHVQLWDEYQKIEHQSDDPPAPDAKNA